MGPPHPSQRATKKATKKLPKNSSPKNLNHLQFHIINAFKNESGQKKVPQKILIVFKFKRKILYKLIGPRTNIIREFPLNLICVYFKGKSLLFFSKKSTFRLIFEKCQPSSVILKIVGATPQLDQNINPQDICPDNFSFVYKYIWI